MSLRKTDVRGNNWFISDEGYVTSASRMVTGSSSTSSALDFADIRLFVGNETFERFVSLNAPQVNSTGDEQVVTGLLNSGTGNIDVYRKTTIADGYVRIFSTYSNTGSTSVTLTEDAYDNIFYDSSTRVAATGSGDRLVAADDDWVLVNSSGTSAFFGRVVSGGAGSPSSLTLSTDILTTRHRFELAAGESKSFLSFTLLAADLESGTLLARDLSNLKLDSYLSGLSEAQLLTLQNFTRDVVASESTELKSFERNLLLTGASDINGIGNTRNNKIEGNDGSNSLIGGSGDDTLIGAGGIDTLIGGTGNDTYIIDRNDVIIENADEGTDTVIAAVSVSIAENGGIENVALTGDGALNAIGNGSNNRLEGNTGNNSLVGARGDDTLIGGGGLDTFDGGTGNDTFFVQSKGVTIIDSAGIDTVVSSISFSLGSLSSIENLTLIERATSATGNGAANRLIGNDQNNMLDGRGGSDVMVGGKGDDTYAVGSAGDVVTELAGEGKDTVLAAINYVLGDNLENLSLVGNARNATGNALDNAIVGNGLNNVLIGLEGDDTLDGGDGTDTLNGGLGDDTYIVNSAAKKFIDEGGTDLVVSSVSFSVENLNFLENIKLVGSDSINATGNRGDNLLIGNAGNNILDGGGGFDTASFETATAGVSVSLSIRSAQATGSAGSDTLINIEKLIGSKFSDQLVGSDQNDVIDGGDGNDSISGGIGDDRLGGGKGNDRLTDGTGLKLLNGGSGDDHYILTGLSTHTEVFDVTGIDTLDASSAAGSSTIDLRPGSGSTVNGSLITISTGERVDSPLDVLFIQDASGSFSDDVSTVKTLVPRVVQTLTGIQADVRFGLASFIDKGEYVYRTDQAMTNDATTLTQAFDKIQIGDGGDTPESQIEALLQAAIRQGEIGFRSDSLKVAVLMTDADFHKGGDRPSLPPNNGDTVLEQEDYPTLSLLKTKLIASGVVPIFAVTAGNESSYRSLVDFLGVGTVTTLASDSSNLASILSTAIQVVAEARVENAIGTSFSDTLIGNNLVNQLSGGAGDDTYYVQNEEDRVIENVSGGRDTVISECSFTLLGTQVEVLKLSGTGSNNATGNSLDNLLHGNSGSNVLDGRSGKDTMYGGLGDDTFVIDNVSDKAIEYANQGTDTVITSLRSYSLGENIENLTLSNALAGTGFGNSTSNVVIGNSGADTLSGMAGNDTLIGGGGADRLIGGEGADSFRMRAFSDERGDIITDFVAGVDRIEIDLSAFAPGVLRQFDFSSTTKQLSSSRFFVAANSASIANPPSFGPTFIYQQDTGKLFFDGDGRGTSSPAVEMLTIVGAPALAATDIYGVF